MIEANACGVPVVASRSPGLCESVCDGETGFLVPHGDLSALANASARLLSDDALWQRMSEAGIRWARRFDWETATSEMEAYLMETAGTGAAAAAPVAREAR